MKLLLLMSLLSAFAASAQPYSLLSNRYVFSDEIFPDQYKSIAWSENMKAGAFQTTIPFSNLSLITDEKGKTYRVVMQFDAERRLVYLGVQHELYMLFQNDNTAAIFFQSCMKNMLMNQEDVVSEEDMMLCLISQLNRCRQQKPHQPR